MAEAGSNSKKPLYVRMADTALNIWNSTGPGKDQWNYERGVLLYGIQQVWRKTREPKYLDYIKNRTDTYVADNGTIPTYKESDYNLDNGHDFALLVEEDWIAQVQGSGQASPRPVAKATADVRGRLLAQASLPIPDVARWSLHGRAVLCRVYPPL